jgi:hypothetical protein
LHRSIRRRVRNWRFTVNRRPNRATRADVAEEIGQAPIDGAALLDAEAVAPASTKLSVVAPATVWIRATVSLAPT